MTTKERKFSHIFYDEMKDIHTHGAFIVIGSIPTLPSASIGKALHSTQREERQREMVRCRLLGGGA